MVNEVIRCSCECGNSLLRYDERKRKRRFISGHNNSRAGRNMQMSVCKTCGKQFPYYKSKTMGVFCSKECQYRFDYPGCFWVGGNGYMYYQKGRGSKVLYHRLLTLAEPGQVVHHIDGNRLNNHSTNLQVMASQSEHIRLHNPVLARWAKQKQVGGRL